MDATLIATFFRDATSDLAVVFCTYDSADKLEETKQQELDAGRPPLNFD